MHSTFIVLFLFAFLKQIHCVIYYLNETEYNRMPPIYHLDDYHDCLQNSTDLYCSVTFSLVSDEPSELLTMIKEYSEHTTTHFNHSKIRHGVCARKTCSHLQANITVTKESLEVCLNNTMWEKYKLKTKIKNQYCHGLSDYNNKVDTSDIVVAVVLLAIILINVVGTLRDVCNNSDKRRDILTCFSITRNWNSLTRSSKLLGQREQSLKGINGLRCIILLGVMMVHVLWPLTLAVNNVRAVELDYYNIGKYVFFNGSIVLQTNLMLTGFFISYKLLIYSEKKSIGWSTVPKGILVRYLRLTPVYAFAIAIMATWVKFAGPGPLWDISGKMVRSKCRSRWWQNLLYINNYTYDAQCLAQAWYLGVDMQVTFVGLMTCVALRNKSAACRQKVLGVMFIISLLLPAIHTYVRDLDAHLILSPGQSRSLLKTDPTFNETYKMGHTNLSSFIVGLALGYMMYRWQQVNIDIKQYRMYECFFWAILPAVLAIVFSGIMFYRDAPRDEMYVRVLYSALAKPIFGILMAIYVAGMILKLENIYRKFLEWEIWTIPSRLSYCMYILHMPLLRIFVSLSTSLLTASTANSFLMLFVMTVLSFAVSLPVWLLIEAPFTKLTKYLDKPSKIESKATFVDSQTEKNNTKL